MPMALSPMAPQFLGHSWVPLVPMMFQALLMKRCATLGSIANIVGRAYMWYLRERERERSHFNLQSILHLNFNFETWNDNLCESQLLTWWKRFAISPTNHSWVWSWKSCSTRPQRRTIFKWCRSTTNNDSCVCSKNIYVAMRLKYVQNTPF